jgi:hypothetical protein
MSQQKFFPWIETQTMVNLLGVSTLQTSKSEAFIVHILYRQRASLQKEAKQRDRKKMVIW